MNQNHLNEERTSDQGNSVNEPQDAATPEQPENAIIHGERETGPLLARFLSPFPPALFPLTSD